VDAAAAQTVYGHPLFSDTVMEHFVHPRNAGRLQDPSGEGWSGSVEDGRFMRIQVCLEEDRIVEAGFGTYGCAPAIASGSFLTEWACGKTVCEAIAFGAEDLLSALGGLPQARRYCATLAMEALHAALLDAKRKEIERREESAA